MRSTIFGISGAMLGLFLLLFSMYQATVRVTYDSYDSRPGILGIVSFVLILGSTLTLILASVRDDRRKRLEPHMEQAQGIVAAIQTAAAILVFLIFGSLFFPGLAWLLIPMAPAYLLSIGVLFPSNGVEGEAGATAQRR